ncbi:TIGR03086 family metal-binding protein [Streptomyces sp. NBC_01795]|uniref:TIGR03086 family metal-binding protein n=1 Tax=Streptomyces sp. NBC_01795 TaxID=2975943 RepID=UPI002DD869D8|nr:TIGR03086 family metal-binding protein [Streptomyces sp. NBC_01795]WSA90972.1 TIGR03086 family metal-binding protein [Streptomyces sp. NBC_01795]
MTLPRSTDPVDSEIVELDRRAVTAAARLVARVSSADLGRATPCAGWTLDDLLAHMTAQHHGFAAAARGEGRDPAVWRPVPTDDPVGAHAAATDAVLEAFAAEGVLTRSFDLPEFGPGARFPGARAVGFHLVDYVVHGWDVARALALPDEVDAEVAAAALRVAEAVPDGPARLEEGSAFRPGLPVTGEMGPLDRTLALLGRSPGWPG